MSDKFHIEWHDSGREPQCAPNPAYPNGKPLNCSDGAAMTCVVTLPYPARRCGAYAVECGICGVRVAATTAGRPDDPVSIKVACRGMEAV